ncbi:probable succinoglycan transport protein [Flavobacteriaceae bacterium 3519-10]|nr:probable succinoglycan transport protein [Flavobacteriaceae bacterium 3519-10]
MRGFSNSLNTKYLRKISDLKNESVSGGMWSMLGQVINFSVQILGTMVLARVLFPEDYGLIAVVGTFTGFVAVFRDMGLTTATIQADNLDDSLFSNIFFINLFVGLLLTIIFASTAPLVQWFYNDDRLLLVTIVSAFQFFLGSLSAQLLALLKRSMNFKIIFITQLISSVSGVVFSVFAAYLGFGYWALVIGPLFSSWFLFIYLFFLFRWIPNKPVWDPRIKSILHFGKHITTFEVVNYLSRNLDNILIAKFFGIASLGIYNKAYTLLMMPINQIRSPLMNVALPALSTLKNENLKFSNYYLNFISVLTVLSNIIILLLIINSKEVVHIVLGPNWSESAKIFAILGIAALVQPIYGTFSLVLISLGKSKKYSTWGTYNAMIIVPSFIIGINFNLEIFAVCYVVANFITFFFSAFYVFLDSPVPVWAFFKRTVPIIAIFSLFAVITYFTAHVDGNIILSFFLKSILFTTLSVAYLVLFYKEKNILIGVIKTFKR